MRTLVLRQLVRQLPGAVVVGPVDRRVVGIAYDSRRVTPGVVFVAMPGVGSDGPDLIAQAVERGAAAVICERHGFIPNRATSIHVPDAREALARAALTYYRHPSARLKVIGVTGSGPRSVVAFLLKGILEASGLRTGLIGSVQCELGGRMLAVDGAAPESLDVQQMLAETLAAGCRACVLEISPQTLTQKRLLGVTFDSVVLVRQGRAAGRSPEAMAEDWQVRGFLTALSEGTKGETAVIQIDDTYGAQWAGVNEVDVELTSGLHKTASLRATKIAVGMDGSRFVVETPDRKFAGRLALMGRPAIHHALAAAGAGLFLGVPAARLPAALHALAPVPGCLEPIRLGQPFGVCVDQADSPVALKQALTTLRELAPGRVLLTFGCEAGRDATHRADLGRVAAELADFTVITSDNPRREPARAIAAAIADGHRQARAEGCCIELDRGRAIRRVIEAAAPGDAVLIAGKGHKTRQEVDATVVPFDDRVYAREALEALGYGPQ